MTTTQTRKESIAPATAVELRDLASRTGLSFRHPVELIDRHIEQLRLAAREGSEGTKSASNTFDAMLRNEMTRLYALRAAVAQEMAA